MDQASPHDSEQTRSQRPTADTLDNLLAEDRTFPPTPEFAAHANLSAQAYARADADPRRGGNSRPADFVGCRSPRYSIGLGCTTREVVRRR